MTLKTMNTDAMSVSSVLSTVQCSDPDEFGSMLPDVRRQLLPFTENFKFFQSELQLGRLRLIIVKRPPCASQGLLARRQIGIALSMNDSPGLRLDGVALDQPVLVTHGLSVPHHIFQPSELTIAAILLPDEDDDREWPERVQAARLDRIRPAAFQHLRSIIQDVVDFVSRRPLQSLRQDLVSDMRLSLLTAIDHAFMTAPGEIPPGLAVSRYVRICHLVDEFLRYHNHGMPSSGEIADSAGVTVRTLHNAVTAVKGMSLQKFIMLNRLWAVRAALVRAGSEDLIKTIALDHGFWHLGRFSRRYRIFFGETPSDTMAAPRLRRWSHSPS
jgi:AraC family transcriptional regulator, ethanolamine operon transcriptional activator